MSYPQEFLGKPFAFWAKLESELMAKQLDRVLPDVIWENIQLKRQLNDLEIKYNALISKIESEQ
jgi:hypothetical protein